MLLWYRIAIMLYFFWTRITRITRITQYYQRFVWFERLVVVFSLFEHAPDGYRTNSYFSHSLDSYNSCSIKIFNQNPNQNALEGLAWGRSFRGIASLEILTKIPRKIRNYYSWNSFDSWSFIVFLNTRLWLLRAPLAI